MTSGTKRLSYQPYLFAIALLSLLSKVAYSVAKGGRVFDFLLWTFIAVFLVSSLLYYLEIKAASQAPGKSISAKIRTGTVTGSEVVGAVGANVTNAKVDIGTKDVKKSKVIGYEEKR